MVSCVLSWREAFCDCLLHQRATRSCSHLGIPAAACDINSLGLSGSCNPLCLSHPDLDLITTKSTAGPSIRVVLGPQNPICQAMEPSPGQSHPQPQNPSPTSSSTALSLSTLAQRSQTWTSPLSTPLRANLASLTALALPTILVAAPLVKRQPIAPIPARSLPPVRSRPAPAPSWWT